MTLANSLHKASVMPVEIQQNNNSHYWNVENKNFTTNKAIGYKQ